MSDRIKGQRYWTAAIACFVVFLLFSSFDVQTYTRHHEKNIPVSGEQQYLSDVEIKKSPGSEASLIEKINASKVRVWIGVYQFTVPRIRESLLQAKNRGVDVRVILEKFPYGNTSINRDTEEFFNRNNIAFTKVDQFAFMHAKYVLVDSSWVIETANMTRTSFSANREFFLLGDDPSILQNLENIFQTDYAGGVGFSTDTRLLAGPTNARERLLQFIEPTQKNLSIYAPSFSDGLMLTDLAKLCYQGKVIRLLLADYGDEDGEQQPDYGTCIQVRKMKKPLHAKVLLRDDRDAFVGSFNYTKNSLENNREIGLFLTGEGVTNIAQTFESDWSDATVDVR